jgi:hypothetical protein
MSKRFPLHPVNERSDAKRTLKAKQQTRAFKQQRDIKRSDYVIAQSPNTFYTTIR